MQPAVDDWIDFFSAAAPQKHTGLMNARMASASCKDRAWKSHVRGNEENETSHEVIEVELTSLHDGILQYGQGQAAES